MIISDLDFLVRSLMNDHDRLRFHLLGEVAVTDIMRPHVAAGLHEVASRMPNARIDLALVDLEESLRKVLIMRFGLDGATPQSFDDTARALGLTRERLRTLEARAMRKLRTAIMQED